MRQVVLGKSGLRVSAVGFGGIPIQRVGMDEAVATIRRALDLGVTFLDTAAGYGDSQRKIGAAIKGRRDGLVLASKSGQRTREAILADVDKARKEMGVDVIDLYQFHGISSPARWSQITAPGGAMEGLLEARERGWIDHIGFSSHSLDTALELVDAPLFETVQFPFNLVTAEPAARLIPLARRNNLGFIVMKPMCGGQFDDADLAFKFLNDYSGLVAIPGIEQAWEIEQIVPLVESGATLAGDDKARADAIAARLGKRFCRRCGYCQPCPQGVPITEAMVFTSFLKRMPPERLIDGIVKNVAQKASRCNQCGECEPKCPYELPIREQIAESVQQAREFLANHSGGE